MSTRTKIEIALGLLLAAAAVFVFYSWLEAHDDRVKMQATVNAQSKVIDQQKQDAAALAAEENRRDAALSTQLGAMREAAGKLQTAQQIAAWIPAQLKTPAPIAISVPPATKTNPAPPATASIPQVDLPALRDSLESCSECQTRLGVAQQDIASRDAQLKIAGEQLSAMQRERDAAMQAAKGGGFWTRLKRNSKWFAIGAGLGAAALCGTSHCK